MKAEIFKAIGQPIRLKIIEILHERELPVGQIAYQVGTDASTVSKHLSLLRKLGIVVDRKEGGKIFYKTTVHQLEHFFMCVDGAVLKRLGAQQAAARELRAIP
ncbi:MAG: metalloregulator ArsR/SmtB family transcription factor [Deltaproteobacteria bacterium]|nr:metalloregulator ArsR/SmtB family transcription factor [Deltaproteobacteria bacterium]